LTRKNISRRKFILKASGALVSTLSFPTIVPSSIFAKPGIPAPSEKITVGCIGVGRMGLGDMKGFLALDEVRVVAVCDVDKKRAEYASNHVNEKYSLTQQKKQGKGCAVYSDYRELIARNDIDAVMITTPDHWHALIALEAARAGKDIFLQKPLTYSIEEGRLLSNTIQKYGNVLLVGSQQRSDEKFRFACELVRNGYIGKLKNIEIGFGQDTVCKPQPVMPVPQNLDYDFWLGPAPNTPYTEFRVHPQNGYGRPGWLRNSDYCLGMITGWGSHHIDIAQWGMGMEDSGPSEVNAWGEYPRDGLWDVHQRFHLSYLYKNGVKMVLADSKYHRQGVFFSGSDGWIHVRRGFIDTHPKSLLSQTILPNEIHLYKSKHHKKNFINCIKTRSETVAPVEIGHRSNSVGVIGYIAMLLGQSLKWDVENERFLKNEQANRMLSRPMRKPWHL